MQSKGDNSNCVVTVMAIAAVISLILSSVALWRSWPVPDINKSLVEIEEWRARPNFEVSYTFSYSGDFSDDRDRDRPQLNPRKIKSVLNSETIRVLEKQGEDELILWLMIENKSTDATHTIDSIDNLNFALEDVTEGQATLEVKTTLAPGEIAAIPLRTFKLEDKPLIYLSRNLKFDDFLLFPGPWSPLEPTEPIPVIGDDIWPALKYQPWSQEGPL